jgi:tetratricopeptide (TPR) repeat protein
MSQPTAFAKRRTEKLIVGGYSLLEEGAYERAVSVGREIAGLGDRRGIEIEARGHAGAGRLDEAVERLERSISGANDDWTLWQLLGHYHSDLGRFDEADRAFRRALDCPGSWQASVRLNQAILLSRRGRDVEALALLERLEDRELRLQIIEARMRALYHLDRPRHAEELGRSLLLEAAEPTDHLETLARIAALTERIRLDRGEPPDAVRRRILPVLNGDRANSSVLALIRDTRACRSDRSCWLRLLVCGTTADGAPRGADGFFVTYDVVAEDVDEALRYAEEIEALDGYEQLQVEQVERLGSAAERTKGVYGYGNRVFWTDTPPPAS